MGQLRLRQRRKTTNWRDDLRVLGPILIIIMVPVVGTTLIQTATTLPDLAERRARPTELADQPPIVDWPALIPEASSKEVGRPLPLGPVRMLGYMMNLNRPVPDNARVRDFALFPEAGTLLHPAHRIPQEMVQVRVKAPEGVIFKARLLVWVQGVISTEGITTRNGGPAHVLTDAAVRSADRGDINLYFADP